MQKSMTLPDLNFAPNSQEVGANFGPGISISGRNILVGAYLDSKDSNNENELHQAGAAFMFSLADCLPYETNISSNICEGDSIYLEGDYQKESGIYYDTLLSVLGCDSVIITALEINPSYYFINEEVVCKGDSVLWQGNYFQNDGRYYANYSTLSGCDSIYELSLTVKSKPNSFSITGDSQPSENQLYTYSAPNDIEIVYSWYVFAGNIINYPSNNSLQVHWGSAGDGRIKAISENSFGCTSDTSILDITIESATGILSEANDGIKVYPNPMSEYAIIEFASNPPEGSVLVVFDISGKAVRELSSFKGNRIVVFKDELPPGLYLIEINGNHQYRGKLIIE